jgi:hypothetical protein
MTPVDTSAEADWYPVCEKCGAPVTTGLMALLCPGREQCAMWPENGPSAQMEAMFPDEHALEEKARFAEYCARRAAKVHP